MTRIAVTTDVRDLRVPGQSPRWVDLRVGLVEGNGWDKISFRPSDKLFVRLPIHEIYATATGKEQRWLPVLARRGMSTGRSATVGGVPANQEGGDTTRWPNSR